MFFKIRVFFTQTRNLILFVSLAIWNGTPLHLWPQAWRDIDADHRARVRRMVFEIRMEGRIRQDADGRLWSIKKRGEDQ